MNSELDKFVQGVFWVLMIIGAAVIRVFMGDI